jgi:hypothetical protein
MTGAQRFIAVALLTREEVATLGSALKTVYRVDDTPVFGDLLKALDEADRIQPRQQA